MFGIHARWVFKGAMLLGVSLACSSPVFSQGRRESDTSWKAVVQAENDLRHESSRAGAEKALWSLSSRAKSTNPDPSACRALALLSRASRGAVGYDITRHETLLPPPAFLRAALSPAAAAKSRDIAKISKSLQPFEEYSLVSGWDYKIPGGHSNPALLPFVEAAYLKALESSFSDTSEGLREALKMLSYAEPRSQGIDRAEALCQLGELMRDIKEFRRAETYLREALDYGNEWFRKISVSSGSGETATLPGHVLWAALKSRIEMLQLLLSFDLIEDDLGEAYAMYCKMRTFYDRGDWWLAFPISIRLKDEYPGTVFGEYGRLAWCRMLLGNDKAGKMGDSSLPSGTKELEKFISDQPHGLYRGEALMELGKFQLEHEWDARKSAMYYGRALEWFRELRKRKDTIDLFAKSAAPDDKLRNQRILSHSSPTGDLSTLNRWNLTERRKPAPMEIINRETAPWYVDQHEKECIFMVGFFLLEEGKFQEAGEYFSRITSLDRDIALLEGRNFPNVLMRLKSCCKTGYIVLPAGSRRLLSPKNRLKTFLAEFKYVLEDFDSAERLYKEVIDDPRSKPADLAAAYMGIGNCHDMIMEKRDSAELFKKAYELSPKSDIGAESLYRMACHLQGNGKPEDSVRTFARYLKEFPDGPRAQNAAYNIIHIYDYTGKKAQFERHAASFVKKYPGTRQAEILAEKISKDRNNNNEEE